MAQNISNLPLGAKIKYGKLSVNGETPQDIVWLIAAKNHQSTPAYPSNSVTLFAENIIDIQCFDHNESAEGSADRYERGNNRYSRSNIDQWLNKDSGAGLWYEATHTFDAARDFDKNRPAFLHHFSTFEKNAILTTTVRTQLCSYDGGGYEDISRKVFIPSASELGVDYAIEGKPWAHIGGKALLTSQYLAHGVFASQGERYSMHWIRTNRDDTKDTVRYLAPTVGWGHLHANMNCGVRPAFNLPSTLPVSDTTDSSGCYTVIWNTAPNKPSTITIPTIYGGKSNTISWTKATDPDGDAVSYQLECAIDDGSYSPIYNGTALSYAHLVPFNTKNVRYRVRAIDPSGATSDYRIGDIVTVINNYAPVISGSDSNLGVKSSGFTGTYTITDANSNAVTVTESIDGVQIRSFVATLGATVTYGVIDSTWLALPNGSHTFTIRATDGMDSSVRTYTFTKLVNSFTIQNTTPLQSTNMPTRIMMVVTRVIPSAATFKVEVCNNGYDSTPTWEDATTKVLSGLVYQFTNTTKTASNWGVKYRITVNRNGATGACYISAIGGNFE